VDLIADSPTLHPGSISADATVSCPLLPHYLDNALHSSSAIFNDRAKHKIRKHGPGSLARHRFFIPLVWSRLAGFGPRSTLAWLRSCFRHAAKLAISTGSSRHDVDQAYTLLFQVLHKTIVTHHHQALQYLTNSPDDPRSHEAPGTHGPPTANP